MDQNLRLYIQIAEIFKQMVEGLKMGKNKIQKEYFSLSDLAAYTGISQRTLRDLLKDPVNPIPYFRIGPAGRIIRIKRSDFDAWAMSQKQTQSNEIDELIAEVLK